MAFLFTNNAISTLAAGIGSGDTSLSVQAGDGALFPNPGGNDSFRCTLADASNNIEIVDVTGRAGDVFTITRAQEGTTANAYLSGDAVELRLTAENLNSYRQGVGDKVVDTAINKSVGLADVHDIINVTAAATITLADAAAMAEGYQITIKNQSTGEVIVNRATGSDTINGVIQDIRVPPGGTVRMSVNANENGYVSLNDMLGAYPIGAIYLSAVATDPSIMFGGTWVQIAEGRTLIGEGTGAGLTPRTAGAELGQEDAIIPSHTHSISSVGDHTHTISSADENHRCGPNNAGTSQGICGSTTTNGAGAHGHTAATVGESVTDKNMPPSLVVYIFQRTA